MGYIGYADPLLLDCDLPSSSCAILENSAIIVSICATRRRVSSTWKRLRRAKVSRDFIISTPRRRLDPKQGLEKKGYDFCRQGLLQLIDITRVIIDRMNASDREMRQPISRAGFSCAVQLCPSKVAHSLPVSETVQIFPSRGRHV